MAKIMTWFLYENMYLQVPNLLFYVTGTSFNVECQNETPMPTAP